MPLNLDECKNLFCLNVGGNMEIFKNNKILFVATKRAASNILKEEAERCNMPYVNERWMGGMLTNYKTIRSSINRDFKLSTLISLTNIIKVNKLSNIYKVIIIIFISIFIQ